MDVITAVLPVILMLLIGLGVRRFQIIDRHGIDSVKKIVTHLFLPFVLFNAMGTATYTTTTILIVSVIFASILLSLLVGYLLRSLVAKSVNDHVPFLLSGFEMGMLGYPLYIALMGAASVHYIATIDIANSLFVFTVYLALITASGQGTVSPGGVAQSALRAPAFYGVVFGILFGATQLLSAVINSPFGPLYTSTITMLTTPVSALILIAVGYTLDFDRNVLKSALTTAGLRLAVQALLVALVWWILQSVIVEPALRIALLLFAFLPPPFISAIYTREKEKAIFASTTTSLYIAVSIAAFVILAIVK